MKEYFIVTMFSGEILNFEILMKIHINPQLSVGTHFKRLP